jgi:hypothetical protein
MNNTKDVEFEMINFKGEMEWIIKIEKDDTINKKEEERYYSMALMYWVVEEVGKLKGNENLLRNDYHFHNVEEMDFEKYREYSLKSLKKFNFHSFWNYFK